MNETALGKLIKDTENLARELPIPRTAYERAVYQLAKNVADLVTMLSNETNCQLSSWECPCGVTAIGDKCSDCGRAYKSR